MPADFGLKLLSRGISIGSTVHFAKVSIARISITGKAAFMSTVEHSHQRILYLAHLRYNPDILKLILVKAEPETRKCLLGEFSSDPFTLRSLDVSPPVVAGIAARLLKPPDSPQQERAAYAPFEILSIN